MVIYRLKILKDIRLLTSQPAAKFYDFLFLHFCFSPAQKYPATGWKGFSNHTMIYAFIINEM